MPSAPLVVKAPPSSRLRSVTWAPVEKVSSGRGTSNHIQSGTINRLVNHRAVIDKHRVSPRADAKAFLH